MNDFQVALDRDADEVDGYYYTTTTTTTTTTTSTTKKKTLP